MIPARAHYRICGLIALAAIWAPSFAAQAEQPPAKSPPAAESKAAPPPRAKPQVIYHLPRTSSYAATLHSQAKGQSTPLPIDNSAPPPPASGPNEAAARAPQEQSASPRNPSRQQKIKRPKFQSKQPQMRKQGPGKGRGPGDSRGNKSRKK